MEIREKGYNSIDRESSRGIHRGIPIDIFQRAIFKGVYPCLPKVSFPLFSKDNFRDTKRICIPGVSLTLHHEDFFSSVPSIRRRSRGAGMKAKGRKA